MNFLKILIKLKTLIERHRSLDYYNPGYPICLAVDGSDYGLGAVIYQLYVDGLYRPLSFVSWTLPQSHTLSNIRKEQPWCLELADYIATSMDVSSFWWTIIGPYYRSLDQSTVTQNAQQIDCTVGHLFCLITCMM